jgi:hypothetical protein
MHNHRAGALIRGGAVAEALKSWCRHGCNAAAWQKVRQHLRDLYPEAKSNSIEAVIRIAQAGRLAGRELQRRAPDGCCPPGMIPDARRLIRDAFRE